MKTATHPTSGRPVVGLENIGRLFGRTRWTVPAMLGGNWLHYVALGIALALASPALGQIQNQKDVEATNQQPRPGTQKQKIAPPPVAPSPPTESESSDTIKWAWRQFYATIVENFALVMTIAVAFAAVVAAFRSNMIARRSAERQLRAYIGVIEGRVERIDDRPFAKLTIKNAGQSPAYGLTNKINGSYREPDEFLFDENDSYFPRFDFLPGETISITHEFMEPRKWDEFLESGRMLYLWGQISFTDAFGKPRIGKFRYRTGDRLDNNSFDLRPTPEGNESD